MTLHIFNPEHDMAMSHQYVTFPKVATLMFHGLGFLPALWADQGDVVVVDDVAYAENAFRRLASCSVQQRCRFVAAADVKSLKGVTGVSPWGWDTMICRKLEAMGIDHELLPSDRELDGIRWLAHRDQARAVLDKLVALPATVGRAHLCTDIQALSQLMQDHGRMVIKAPWSGSGRGVRFVDTLDARTQAWASNIIRHQGGVMVEPFYPHVMDFGMEFMAQRDGTITYCGLSVFTASNGAYNGNVLATEDFKQKLITRYIPDELLMSVRQNIMAEMTALLRNKYHGPFGVDMMIVEGGDAASAYLLHPCVEINLRRTMGHVALTMQPPVPHLMTINTKQEFMVDISTTNIND